MFYAYYGRVYTCTRVCARAREIAVRSSCCSDRFNRPVFRFAVFLPFLSICATFSSDAWKIAFRWSLMASQATIRCFRLVRDLGVVCNCGEFAIIGDGSPDGWQSGMLAT